MLLLAAAVLPSLFWDAAPKTVADLREAGITKIAMPAKRISSWKTITDISIEPADPAGAVKIDEPSIDYQATEGRATAAPWLKSNCWRYLRQPQATFFFDAHGNNVPVALAEAFTYGVRALFRVDQPGLQPAAAMLRFLQTIPPDEMPAVADIGFVDDGSAKAGEVLSLLTRGNLLVQLVKHGDARNKLTVEIGTADYSRKDADNPGLLAQLVRSNLTDERRSFRIFGSEVVLGRVVAAGDRLRVYLLNYAAAKRSIRGVRIRVVGSFSKHKVAAFGSPDLQLLDYVVDGDATEFTLPELKSFAVVDLSR